MSDTEHSEFIERAKNMTNDPSYRLYLEEKFEGLTKHLHAQFENVHETLKAIETQTTKTNGRVTDLEEEVDAMSKDMIKHPLECPKGKDIEIIKDYISNSKSIKSENRKRYENILKVIGIIIALATLGLSTYFSFHSNKQGYAIIKKQDDQSIPFVVNPRGKILLLPDSTRLIWFNNDSARYLIKREE